MPKAQPTPIDEQPERRQTLAAILVMALGYLPLARFLSWQITAFLALVLALRLAAVRWPQTAPGRVALLGLTAVGGLNCLHVYHGEPGRASAAALFVTMLGLKLMELRARRDHRILAVLLGFLAVVALLFDQSAALAAWQAAIVFASIVLLVDLNGGLGDPGWRRPIRLAGRFALESIPIAIALFVLFPRLASPLWSFGIDRDSAVTGMTDRLEPGAIGKLVLNGDLAFRARFDRPPPPAARLYWRGLVLWDADDSGWSPGLDPLFQPERGRLTQVRGWIDYEVVLEASHQRWIFALDLPTEHPRDTQLSADFQLLAATPIDTARRYRLQSAQEYRTPDPPAGTRRYALQLPDNVTQRMRQLVAGWRAGAVDDWGVVQAALAHFNREPFSYTLEPPRLGSNPTDEFLFETRSGFCEHYASSFGVLMRIAGIPSRVVLGYLGGEPNRIGGYYMVWQSDAHAWTEVLIPGRGWVRVDPTAAIAASRVDNSGASRLLGAGNSVRFQLDADSRLGRALRQARALADSLDALWQDWVLDYAVENQRSLLERLGLDDYGESALVTLMIGVLGLVLGLFVVALIRGGDRLDPLERSYALFCRRLARLGLRRGESEGPQDYGRRIVQARPDLAEPVGRILAVYIRERFSGRGSAGGGRRLAGLVGGFRPGRKRT